ncbi:unnamed protein product [Heligmosomoides polygyrus]|uniref:PDZ domain-containing protein n=1 Tax=Heligmosomoides polygyrus TaxID=6339 RepID=A0A3P8DUV8_HELPZ|nr:unnamed protein product [Heligmosomoides polygyrus]
MNRSVFPSAYMPSPPSAYAPPPSAYQNGGFYATLGRNSNYASYTQPTMSSQAPFSYTNGSAMRSSSNYASYPEPARPIYTTSHLNGHMNGMSLQNSVPPEQVGDQLISINGRDTKGLTHEEAIQLIKQHPTVRLTVRRHKLP